MKRQLFIRMFLALFPLLALGQTPRLEIHHIGAGDGDATLIIAIDTARTLNLFGQKYLDTAIVLIDGQRSSGGKEVWRYVRDTLNALSPTLKRIDAIVVSHLHIDHYGGIPGVISSAKISGWDIGAVFDRQGADYADYDGAGAVLDSCYDSLLLVDPNAAAFERYNDTLEKYNLYPTRTIQVNENLLSQFTNIYMVCVAAYGLTLPIPTSGGLMGTSFLPVDNSSGMNYYVSRSENDLSIGFFIGFQGFHYLTSGDLGGTGGGNYLDGETPMTQGILGALGTPANYHVCANKVSHHGSQESTSAWFVATNNFTASVFPACLRSYGSSNHALPTQSAITNLNTGTNNLLFTYIPNNPQQLSSYWQKGNLLFYNDVIIKILGAPGNGQNVSMSVLQRAKTKQGVYQGQTTVQTIICNKGHNW